MKTTQAVYRPYDKATIPVIVPARSSGHYIVQHGYQDVAAVKHFVQLFWCVNGKGRFIIDGKEHFLEKEHVCMYFPGDKHLISAVSYMWEYFWFTTDCKDYKYLIKNMNLRKQPFYAGKCPQELFVRLSMELRDFSPSGQYRASATAYEILTRAVSGESDSGCNGLVEEFKHLVDMKYSSSEASINQLAEELNVHRSTLNRIFKQETGITPGDYLISYRVQEALSLLKNTNLRIGDVAYKVGFHDANYFTKVIKKATGSSPAVFRKT